MLVARALTNAERGHRAGVRLLRLAVLTMGAVGSASCASNPDETGTRADSARAGGAAATAAQGARAPGPWRVLFDGSSLDAWRGYKREDVPPTWKVEDGTLAFIPEGPESDRADLITRDQFSDFELEYEWKISPAGNSGVMWRVSEELQYPWQTGPEQQVLDDERHPDNKIPSHLAGALYDLVAPPSGIVKPVGEFNQARVVARGSRVQTFLNGHQTADVDFASPEGKQLLASSKFRTMPRFAQNARGHIVLQTHGDRVWYRNIRVRELPPAPAP